MDVRSREDAHIGCSLGGVSLVFADQQALRTALVHMGEFGLRFDLDPLGSYEHHLVSKKCSFRERSAVHLLGKVRHRVPFTTSAPVV